jgi:hypothetical protein
MPVMDGLEAANIITFFEKKSLLEKPNKTKIQKRRSIEE